MRCELIEMPFILQGFYARQLEIFHCSFSRQQLLLMGCEELKVDTRGHVYCPEDHFGLSHYSWAYEQLQPHFEGGYLERIPSETRRLLADYTVRTIRLCVRF